MKTPYRTSFLLMLTLVARANAQGQTTLFGPVAGGQFGRSIGAAGDVNGDGLTDIIVGAPYTTNPSTGQQTGAAYVYTGSGTLLRTWYGTSDEQFGFSVAGAGDVNGDGRADLIVGSPWASPSGFLRAGRATIYSGANGAVLFTVNGDIPNLHLGYSVAGAGFVNADSFADVIVGSDHASSGGPSYPGSAVVAAGPSGQWLHVWNGDADNVRFGNAVASAGDVNGDGRSDLIVGAPFDMMNAGSARVFSGATGMALYTLYSAHPGENFGASVAGAGDVTGDGRSDVIVGQPQGTITGLIRGTAQVFDGASGVVVRSWEGSSGMERFGAAVASAGDIDRDGRPDLLVGAPGDDTQATDGGGARIYSGRTGLRLVAMTQGGVGSLEAGSSVAGMSFAFSGHGLQFAYGAGNADWNGTDSGAVWIYTAPNSFRFALGDGTGAACPCGLIGSTGSGCRNPASAIGGRLDACGTASVSADTMSLAANYITFSTAIFLQGTEQTNEGLGTPFGNGIMGIGGSIIRFGVRVATLNGGNVGCLLAGGVGGGGGTFYPAAGELPISVRGGVPAVGGSRNYQLWYRTAATCGGATTNLTNGISIAWGP